MTRLALSDGRHVEVRQLGPNDALALVDAVGEADPADLRRRFMGCPPPASFLVERLLAADGVHNFALGAFDDTGRLVAVAQFDRPDDRPTAEVAVEVATDWQHHGLGTGILEALAMEARERGIRRLTAQFFADNLPIRRLLDDLSSWVAVSYDAGEGQVVIDLGQLPEPEPEAQIPAAQIPAARGRATQPAARRA